MAITFNPLYTEAIGHTLAPTQVEDMPPLREESPREEVIRHLEQIVHEAGPDFVYKPHNGTRCQYVHRDACGNPSGGCLIGRLLLKVSPEVTSQLEFHNSAAVRAIPGLFPQRWRDDQLLMAHLQSAQEQQDLKVPWGTVLDNLKRGLRD